MLKKNKYTVREDKRVSTTVKARRKDGTEYRKFIAGYTKKELAQNVYEAEKAYSEGKTDFDLNLTFHGLAEIYFTVSIYGTRKAYSYQKSYEKHLKKELGRLKTTEIRMIHVKNLLKILTIKGLAKKR